MKRKLVLFFICMVFAMLISLQDTYAATWKFVWENTTVTVPVGEAIDSYKNVPYARLYKDNVLLSDAEITYNTEGDWLYYFKDVNTSKTGEYKVWYKAYDSLYSPGTCTGYKSLVTFQVVDDISPTIDVLSDTFNIKRGDEFDLSLNYKAHDNYALKEVTVVENIDAFTVGNYPVEVTAIDESYNKTTASFTAVVYETEAPVISCSAVGGVIEVPLNEDFDVKSYFTATDRVEGDISINIVYPPLINDEIGQYSYTVKVTNKAGLSASYSALISVIDNAEPSIILTTHTLMLDFKDDVSTLDYTSYIKSISDNSSVNYDNLTITSNIEQKVGSYYIYYSYTDGIYTVTDSIDVVLMSYDKPVITVDNITTYVKENVNLLDYIHITDPSDDNVLSTVTIDDSAIDYTKAGTYYATVYCMNSSGISNEERFKVVVKNNSWFSSVNAPLAIIMIVTSVISLALICFIVFYFVFRKKIH